MEAEQYRPSERKLIRYRQRLDIIESGIGWKAMHRVNPNLLSSRSKQRRRDLADLLEELSEFAVETRDYEPIGEYAVRLHEEAYGLAEETGLEADRIVSRALRRD